MIRLIRIPLLHMSDCSKACDNEECMWGEAKEEGGNKHYLIKKQLLCTMCNSEAARIHILQAPQMNIRRATCRSKHLFSQKIWEGQKKRQNITISFSANCDIVTWTSNEHSRNSLCVSVEIRSVPLEHLSNDKVLPTPCCFASFKTTTARGTSLMHYSHNW